MNTKKCEKCGWEYPIDYPDKRCKFCNTIFKKRICSDCGTYTDIMPKGSICMKCQYQRTKKGADRRYRDHYIKVRKEAADKLAHWQKLFAAVPTPLRTLTEEDWVAACKHFGKCALCGIESIDARGMFIPFDLGGRYTAWNIIPICDKCATKLKLQPNPFVRNDPHLYPTPVPTKAIEEYLMPILERTIRDAQRSIQEVCPGPGDPI